MKVKLDENVPAGLVDMLRAHSLDAKTVPEEGIGGQSDDMIWETVRREGCLLVSMDLDFADIRRYAPGAQEGILILRPARQGRLAIRALLEAVLTQVPLETFLGCLAVADERGIRKRKAAG